MSREKQIDEMRNDVEHIHRCFLEDDYDHFDEYIAVRLFEKGYRKASEVAEEIFEEIEENLNNLVAYYKEKRKYVTETEYSESEQRYYDIKIKTFEERLLKMSKLKKKYTEEVK